MYLYFPTLNSLNFITSHPFLHDCPLIVPKNVLDKLDKYNKSLKRLISCAFSLSPVSLIITSIHSFTVFTKNPLLLILHAKYSMTWHAVAISLESDPCQGWLYWHSKRWTLQTSVKYPTIRAWRPTLPRDDRLTLKRWTFQTSDHRHLLNRSCRPLLRDPLIRTQSWRLARFCFRF